MSDATETLGRLEAIVRRGLTTRTGLMSFEGRCAFMAQLLYDGGARLYPYPVETDEVDAEKLAAPEAIKPDRIITTDVPMTEAELEKIRDTFGQAAVHPEPDPADGYDYGSTPKVQAAPPAVPLDGFPATELRVWNEGEPEPSGRPPVVCADGVTALWDPEHDGWSRQLVTHHLVPEGAPKGSVGAVTMGLLGETWVDLLADFGPVREATEHEARLVTERWLDREDKAS